MNAFGTLLFLCIFSLFYSCDCKYGYVVWSEGKPVASVSDHVADIPGTHVARAIYSNKINSTGWAFLELHTSANSSDEKQAYAAGFLEGYLTRDLVWMHWQNMLKGYCYNKIDVCGLIEEFVDTNEKYINTKLEEDPDDPYWHQVKLYYIQLEGLAAGYNAATSAEYQWLSNRDIVWFNMLGDLDDLAFALAMPKETPEGFLFGERCTGLVKLLPGLKELYTAQTTWNSYQSMLRIQKMYVLNYRLSPSRKELIPGYKMSLSSYPAFVQSTDDFYIISSGLVASETTIGNSNRTLFEKIAPVGQILEYARAMVANRLARDGCEWVHIFRKYNSGTYNNQWYIVDYNMFKARTAHSDGSVSAGLLWVIEQLPGYTKAADLCAGPRDVLPLLQHRVLPPHLQPERRERAREHVRGLVRVRHQPESQDAEDEAGGNPQSTRHVPHYALQRLQVRPVRALRRVRPAVHRLQCDRGQERPEPTQWWSQFDMGPQISHIGHPDRWMFTPLVHLWEWP